MTSTKIIIKYALLIILLIGGFFFLCKLLGLEENPYLRFLNLLFVIIGIRQAIKTSIFKNKETNYATNLGIGIQTSAIAVVVSIIGVALYVHFINPEFLAVMNSSFLIGGDLSLSEIVITLLIEGMASSVIGAFIIMQFYKNHDKENLNE
ncbi:hypothetical protein FDT66_13130 [Polaribacter aestuariivivens]|uniref:DUF4199 domain-containing protein n=1 Tax=Polaribacter aestuariivivens TaxID=2304626 RepID=A0A5S3N206_9FLAO|nr:hypothetical protein [Polaribacter aestuariivivens]TMM28842.1 hypothetical protein FDT66_13130 [Polaribacter aestuariivivens]